MSEKIVPTHGVAYFLVTKTEINEILEFTYWDPQSYYAKILDNPEKYEKEINTLWRNMQIFLDEELIKINDKIIKPEVNFVGIVPRGFIDVTSIIYYIKMSCPLKEGKNTFITITKEETTEYDFDIFWFFPARSKIIKVTTKLEYEWKENKLLLWARKGKLVGGQEEIVALVPKIQENHAE
ncbi:MAG: hypothetical protein ACP6IS_00050 [Candidatus Asgardarchaeia archaeon]